MTFIRWRGRRHRPIARIPTPMIGIYSGHKLAVNQAALAQLGITPVMALKRRAS